MRKKLSGNSVVKNILIAIAVGLIVLLVGALIGAFLIHKELIGINSLSYVLVVILLVAALLASVMGMKGTTGKERLIAGTITALGLWLVMIGCNLLICDSDLSGVWITLILFLASSTSGFLLFQNRGKKKKYKIPKM